MAAAALARTRPRALKSLTLLAAQTDFTDPGELSLFTDEGQVEMLDDLMWRQGVLHARQMKSTFEMLRSRDLIWSYRVTQLAARRASQPFTDLMAWNADGTRLPYRMHSDYLHTMFLDNALARGKARLAGHAINLADIRVPIFNVGAVQDHVAPWRSVFKLHALTDAEQTFVLTAGGHNVGIVNPRPDPHQPSHPALASWRPPAHAGRMAGQHADSRGLMVDALVRLAAQPLVGHPQATAIGGPGRARRSLADAPGHYVLER